MIRNSSIASLFSFDGQLIGLRLSNAQTLSMGQLTSEQKELLRLYSDKEIIEDFVVPELKKAQRSIASLPRGVEVSKTQR